MGNKIAVLYCRVSTKEQVEEGNSLVTQEKNCRAFAEKHGYTVASVFIEQGESAKTADRPQLQKLLQYCSLKKNNVNTVIAYKIDRISRNTADYSQIRLLLKKYNVEIKSTTEFFEDTPAGRFMENIIANVAQFDNDVRTERTIGGMKEALREGRYVFCAPYGYDNVRVNGKATIVQNDKALFVLKAFEEVAKNVLPTEQIRQQLIKEGMVRTSGRPIGRSQFYELLRNPLYAGWMTQFNERNKGFFAPIVTDTLFNKVQHVLQSKRGKSCVYTVKNKDFPLRRLMKHPNGSSLTGSFSTGRYKRYPYYRFHKPTMSFKKEELERRYMQYLDRYKLDTMHLIRLRRAISKEINIFIQSKTDRSKQLKQKSKLLEQKRNMLVDKNLKGVISDNLLVEQLNLIEQEYENIRAELNEVEIMDTISNKIWKYAEQYLTNPSITWKNCTYNTQLRLQRFHFPKGVLFDGNDCRTTNTPFVYKSKSFF